MLFYFRMETDHLTKSLSLDGSQDPSSFLGSSIGPISPVTLQMQKHLLSSTQTCSESGRIRVGRNGSCSPTPALPYTPTPSPSPFNPLSPNITSSLPDLNLSLSTDSKTLNFLHEGKQGAAYPGGYEDMEVRSSGPKYAIGALNHIPLGAVSPADLSSMPRYSPQIELNSVLTFTEQSQDLSNLPVSSQDKIKSYIVMDANGGAGVSNSLSMLTTHHNTIEKNLRVLDMSGTDKILPVNLTAPCITTLNPVSSQQITCLIPAVTTQHITCITNLQAPVTTQISCVSAVPSLTSSVRSLQCPASVSSEQNNAILTGGYDSYSTSMIHPKKKRRLLTFLTEENNMGTLTATSTEQAIIVNQSQPSKSDTFILSSSCPSLVSVSSSPTLIINPSGTISSVTKPEPTIFLNTSTKNSIPSTIYISEGSNPGKETNPDVYLNQAEGIGKNEQTLIINSDGTQATLITPVSAAQATLLTSQTSVRLIFF